MEAAVRPRDEKGLPHVPRPPLGADLPARLRDEALQRVNAKPKLRFGGGRGEGEVGEFLGQKSDN